MAISEPERVHHAVLGEQCDGAGCHRGRLGLRIVAEGRQGTCQRTCPSTLTSVAHACRGGTGPPHPESSWLCDERGQLRGVVAARAAPGWLVLQAARRHPGGGVK
jgi:hypothetical protein